MAGSKGGTPLPQDTKEKMESLFGTDFSDVRVHTNSSRVPLGAGAYAMGNDIHFAPGQYDPGSKKGRELLGHELTHTVQQKQGRVRPRPGSNGLDIIDDPVLEREAEQMGKKAAEL